MYCCRCPPIVPTGLWTGVKYSAGIGIVAVIFYAGYTIVVTLLPGGSSANAIMRRASDVLRADPEVSVRAALARVRDTCCSPPQRVRVMPARWLRTLRGHRYSKRTCHACAYLPCPPTACAFRSRRRLAASRRTARTLARAPKDGDTSCQSTSTRTTGTARSTTGELGPSAVAPSVRCGRG